MSKSFYCSIEQTSQSLPTNLYADNKGRAGVWRYKHPQKGIKYLHNLVQEIEPKVTGITQAIEVAEFLNLELYGIKTSKKTAIKEHVENEASCFYIDWVKTSEFEDESPTNTRWIAQKNLVQKFCDRFEGKPVQDITMLDCDNYIKSLSYHVGRASKTALNKFFYRLNLVQAVISFNPFNPGSPQEVKLRKVPAKLRRRMDKEDLTAMINAADNANQVWFSDALKLGILLRLRRDDILNLRFEDVQENDNFIHCTVNKSVNQKGMEKGQILLFDLREPSYKEAHDIIKAAYKNRFKDVTRAINRKAGSPTIEEAEYVINAVPKIIPATLPKGKTQMTQVTCDHLTKTFTALRANCLFINKKAEKEGLTPTSFHELRSLGARIDRDKGMAVEDISLTLAHSDLKVTNNKYLSENISRIEVAKTAVSLEDFA